MRRTVALLLAGLTGSALLAGGAGCTTGAGAASETAAGSDRYVAGDGKTIVYEPGQRKDAPKVSGSTVDGGTADLANLKGSVVVINFWASWCPPCRLESTDLESVYKSTKDSGVAFVGVNSRDERDAAQSFAATRLTYPSLYDPNGRIALRFADVPPTALPCTLIIDRAGKVAVVIRNTVRIDTLTPLVQQIAAEKA
jgi:peroxiredoxin